jgi:peptidyl-prolyl cis-trans isomerase SurA
MGKIMKKVTVFAALLFALPLLAQNPPSSTPPQNPPASNQPQDSAPPAQNPPQPKLEAPPTAAPEPDVPKEKTPTQSLAPKTAPKKVTTGEGKVVEEIIARVNNEIITSSELEKSRAAAAEDAQQQCNGKCTQEQQQVAIEDAQKTALRDLIDQSLLAQRGKDMGISVEPDVVKQLDQIRIKNNLPDMDALEKAVTQQGLNWDDFKTNIRNRLLTREVIGREVGSHINIGHDETKKYYDDHKQEFERPEQVALRAIEIVTTGKKDTEIPDLKKKAETLLQRVKDGEDFNVLAKKFSDGSTAQDGGYLGVYKRGELSKELEDKVFTMNKNQLTDVIETKQGFLILQVLERYEAGIQPYEKVEPEIMDKLYSERMEPALREYLKTLREQSYVVIKPGYQDMAGGGNSEIQEVSAAPEVTKEKKPHKKYLLFGPRGD